MKKILVASVIMLSALVACTKNAPVASTDASSTTATLTDKHGADDTGSHSTVGIPPAVVSSFNTRYPAATRAEFEKETEHGVTTYKVKFYLGAQRWIAFFKPDGTFISARLN